MLKSHFFFLTKVRQHKCKVFNNELYTVFAFPLFGNAMSNRRIETLYRFKKVIFSSVFICHLSAVSNPFAVGFMNRFSFPSDFFRRLKQRKPEMWPS